MKTFINNKSVIRIMALLLTIVLSLGFTSVTAHAAVITPDDAQTPAIASEEIVVEKVTIDEVPLYNQGDYKHVQYGSSSRWTVASHGCGIVSVSMIATYLTDEVAGHDPATLATKYGHYNTENGSYWTLFADLAAKDQLNLGEVVQTSDWDIVKAALENGQVVVSLQRAGRFTSGGHFIVLTGINEEGRIMVNDPNGRNWTKNQEMIDGFENGFTDKQITASGIQYWIYQPKAEVQALRNGEVIEDVTIGIDAKEIELEAVVQTVN